jgi:enamine deaminase RidA (YjgF/YER057c/UK114 family)
MPGTVEGRLKQLGHSLPTPPAAVGSYVPAVRTGNLIVTSGQLPMIGKTLAFKGKVGKELTEHQGSDAAVICVLNALAQIKALAGDLDNVKQIVRVDGYVQSADGFTMQPHVMNEASELLAKIFGDAGRHSRIAIGCNELPLNASVEVSIWAEVEE